ncbi:hypothetical protein BGZ95_001739 [Linnemannia exigua]|uniref:Uncharacterized protein n=1 Tax=Linnemannia exigua TaxID=604196 RepID=A0AAD4D8L6_9FUNG|nr:hypothetical protein BGZ95_001739 [Linnemannia exigua]
MGFIDIICLTTNPEATTFYGLAYATTQAFDQHSTGIPHNVLVKSNTNPSLPNYLTWSVVAKIPSSKVLGYGYSSSIQYSCAINAQEIFTMIGRITDRDQAPFGVRYDPAGTMDPSFDYHGPGAWVNITADAGYTLPRNVKKQALGYVSNGGANVLIYASLSDVDNTISLATVSEADKAISTAGTWALNITSHGKVGALTIANDNLYSFGTANATSDPIFLSGFPLIPIKTATPASMAISMTGANTCNTATDPFIYNKQESLTLLCGDSSTPTQTQTQYTIEDINVAPGRLMAKTFTANIAGINYFVPIGKSNNAANSSSFILFSTKGGPMYGVGYGGASSDIVYNMGRINVAEDIGDESGNSDFSEERSWWTGARKAQFALGCVVAVMLLIGLIYRLTKYYKDRKKRKEVVELDPIQPAAI